ncbi:sulfurtransferase [Nakamurella deserti]|uniref:sulfurtransferase n=1 Tax=Nakamurella deserti TaxID=2164074 RepID=UPI00197C7A61|nr:sulfurtransferase [Nakamurella deserti]
MAAVLVTAVELAEELIGDRPPVVLDVRWSLAGSDPEGYRAGHVPGSLFVDLDADLAAPVGNGSGGRHPLPDPAALQATWRRVGIRATDGVVVYDADNASAAARAWWLLRWSGLTDVRVLDGGMAAWRAAGLWVKAGSGTPLVPGTVRVRPGGMPTVDADGAAALAAGGALVDARAAARFRGEVEPVDPVAGHIPGAVNVPFTSLVTEDGRFRSADEIGAAFAAVRLRPGTTAAASCGSGVTACHLVLAGAVAGIDLALYPGSWSQWCALGRPVEVG